MTGKTTPLAWECAVKLGQMYLEVSLWPGGVVRTYAGGPLVYASTLAGTAVSGQMADWEVTYDAVAKTLTTTKDSVQVSQLGNVTWAGGPDGRWGINNRPGGGLTTLHTGLVDNIMVWSN
jgi:hypothetical protein